MRHLRSPVARAWREDDQRGGGRPQASATGCPLPASTPTARSWSLGSCPCPIGQDPRPSPRCSRSCRSRQVSIVAVKFSPSTGHVNPSDPEAEPPRSAGHESRQRWARPRIDVKLESW